MSRESDSSSSGSRKGSGAAAYPPGTPPYGSRQYPSPNPTQEAQGGSGDGEARAAARPEEPKTETTLTTRIRINIPGSRPIPPVVMRTPVGEEGMPNQRSADDSEGVGDPAGPDAAAAAGPGAAGAAGGEHSENKKKEERTSDWFAPRKAKGNTSTTGSTPQPPAPPAATPPAPGPAAADPFGADPFGAGAFAPEASAAAPSAPETTQQFPAPDFSAPETTQQFPAPPPDGGPGADLPYFTDTPPGGFPGAAEPSGPTTGPATGDMRLPTRGPGATRAPLGGGAGLAAQPPTPPNGSPLSGSLGATTGASPASSAGPLGGPGGKPGTDAPSPLFRDPDPTPGGGVPAEHVSGETLVSGIPVVPPTENRPGSPFPPAGSGSASPATSDKDGRSDQAGSPAPPAAPAAARPKKKGRSKLVMAVGALVVIGGIAYGAGLVMNHADVPNGTTVLGVDIGGTSKETAVQKLDTALEGRTGAPLKVSVDGEQKEIKPTVAGLTLDTEATVRNVAGRDYNPVTVIGSLFGGTHTAEPVVTVDEEKLRDALQRLAGTSGTAREGTIKFEPGKAVAVYGKAGKGLDVDKAVAAVDEAFRQRAATGQNKVIALPVVTKQPQVSNAEVDRKMRTFARPAMSGLVKVQTDPVHSLPLSPQNSLWKILSVRVVDGKLVEHYDLAALKELYGGLFDGVLIQRGNGSKQPVAPTDVAVALGQALKGKTPAERIGIIETNGN